MRTYQLQIYIDPKFVLQFIQAGQQIVISKQVTPAGPSIAWLSFSPVQHNTVEWQDQYWVYASQNLIQPGATILEFANQSAVGQSAYGVTDFPAPTAPHSTLGVGMYEVVNQSSQTLTLGLAQVASVNGTTLYPSPVCAAPVQPGEWINLTPSENIIVSLFTNTTNGTCLGPIVGPSISVPALANTNLQKISYQQDGFHLS
jgi:hypothetical protein